MQLIPKEDLRLSAPPVEAVRTWVQDPLTVRFFNLVYHEVMSGAASAEVQLGFVECRNQVLGLLLEAEARLAAPVKVEAPVPDYGAEAYVAQRQEMLGIKPRV